MKKFIIFGLVLILIAVAWFILRETDFINRQQDIPTLNDIDSNKSQEDIPRLTTIAQNLEIPWAIAFLPDNNMLVTERPGSVVHVDIQTGEKTAIATLPEVVHIGEGGLLGVTLHPDFEENNYIYFYYTYRNDGNNTLNRVVRMSYENQQLTGETTVLDQIPGASNHNGGRIHFGPDNYLYITTGDAQQPSSSQNTRSLAGKILRVTDIGEPAPDNPFNNEVYSYGHRNPQGICWHNDQLFSTEHGRSGAQSGLDELNLIRPGANYGWPEIQGDVTQSNMQKPLIHSGAETWAPASAACIDDRVYFGGLRGNTLYEAEVQGDAVKINRYLEGDLGRIREVIVGPDNMLYISTSNRDGRGIPASGDDRIIRINPSKL